MHNNILALLLLLVAAFMNSLLTVLIEFLQNQGASWVQTLCYSLWTNTSFIVLSWLGIFSYNYFICKKEECKYYDNFANYLLSSLPELKCNNFSLKQWGVLGMRSFFGVLTYAFYCISILYCDSGNVILIETVLTSIGNLILGWYFFNEKLNVIIYISLIICVAGLVLVTKPTFIFNNNNNNNSNKSVSLIGFVFMTLAGVGRAFYNAFIKQTESIKISNSAAILVPEVLTSIIIFICYLIGNIFWDLSIINQINNNTSYTLLLISLGAFLWIWIVTATIGFRIGEVGRLGIINNTDIVITYFLQISILKETDGILCYVGAGLVCVGCIIIFWEQSRANAVKSINDTNSINGMTVNDSNSLTCVIDHKECADSYTPLIDKNDRNAYESIAIANEKSVNEATLLISKHESLNLVN